MNEKDQPPDSRSIGLKIIAVTWNFGWPLAAGVVIGNWLDEKLGTSPFVALFLGIGSLAVAAWRLIQLSREEERAHRGDAGGPP